MDKLYLGENYVSTTDCDKTGLNNNILVIGGSGSGKTMSYVQPNLLHSDNRNLIVTLSKRNIVTQYMKLFKQKGYKVYDMNFAKPSTSTCSFDPLRYLKNSLDVSSFARSIVYQYNGRASNDPFWDESAYSLLVGVIGLVKYTNKYATFADVVSTLTNMRIEEANTGVRTNLDSDFKRAYIQFKDFKYYYDCYNTFVKNPPKTAGCVYTTLSTRIDKTYTPELLSMIRKEDTFDFNRFCQEKSILFITSSCVNKALNSFIDVFYSMAFKNFMEIAQDSLNYRLQIPLHFIMDDFACTSTIEDFTTYISMIRECNISVSILIQSQSQLNDIYSHNKATTIINNCDRILFMGSMDIETANNMSLRLNIPREDVLYMPVGKMYIIERGKQPIYTSRYQILKDESYIKLMNTQADDYII